MLNRVISILILTLLVQLTLIAQDETILEKIRRDQPNPVGKSPNVASLGRFGAYTVNYHNGLPEISIPIYEVTSGNLRVPITLSYHASGIKMTDMGSWVGLGWSLSAGGQISRDVKGAPDEEGYYTTELLANPNICTNYNYLYAAANGGIDTQADVFSYSFPGKSGTFTLGHEGASPFLIPYSPIVITHDQPTIGDSFELNHFQIVDDNGVRHRFGSNLQGATATENTSGNTPGSVRTAWHLMEIVSSNSDDRIDMTYQSVGGAIMTDRTSRIVVVDECHTTFNRQCFPDVQHYQDNPVSSVIQLGLKEIFFSGGKVEFVLGGCRFDQSCFSNGNGLKSLDEIRIYSELSGTYSLVKKIKFLYSYFTNPNGTGVVRQKLDGVHFLSSDGNVVQKYSFDYHTNYFSWNEGTLFSRDLFGYYNGKQNDDLIPPQTIEILQQSGVPNSMTIGTADRSTVPQYLTEGVLKAIHFPTGGHSEFNFEPHKYQENGVEKIVGGLRIANIKTYDGLGNPPTVKTYKYGLNESGYGYKNFLDLIAYYHSETYYIDRCPMEGTCGLDPQGYPIGDLSYRTRAYFSNPIQSISAHEGSAVVYPYVTEYYGDSGTNIGKIVYTFDNGQHFSDLIIAIQGPASSKSHRDSHAWERGRLTSKRVFDRSGRELSRTETSYSVYQTESRIIGLSADDLKFYKWEPHVGAVSTCVNESGSQIDMNKILWTHARQSSGVYLPTQTVTTYFQDGDNLRARSSTSSNTYHPTYLQPIESRSSSSLMGEEVVTRSTYPFSYSFSGTLTGAARAVQMLKEKNVLSLPIESYTARRNVDMTNERVISGQANSFKQNPNNLNYVVQDETFVLENTAGLPSFAPLTLTSSNYNMDPSYKAKIKFKSFDRKGNIEELQKVNDIPISYIWGYNGDLPIAEVTNTTLDRAYGTTNYFYGASISTNQVSQVALTPSITIDYQQTVPYTIQFFMQGGTPTIPPLLDLVLKRSDGSIVFDPAAYELGTYTTTLTLQPGVYTFYYQGQSNSSTVRFNITLDYTTTTSYPKASYTSFEETGVTNANAKTGTKVFQGQYNVTVPSYAGNYIISWWESSNSGLTWTFKQQPFVVPYGSSFYTVGGSGLIVDEVRLHPETSLMKTYTYSPALGMTSTTDENGNTTYYDYDTFGRLHLIKDSSRKIVKMYQYHYKD